MLGILILIFIGRHFYKLAEKYNKNAWLFAILGIVAYYVGTLLAGVILGVLMEIFSWNIDFENNYGLGIIALPFGIGMSFLFYSILKPNWKEQYERNLDNELYRSKALTPSSEEE
ncbi:hypothetical protein [Winogradskyella jejuensis]|uniref:Uncharacterized protein n=1 Tax=Winogradskyella jejuensis TaxID=1089305 RepID=A0A1M5SWH7_9FLAO|nr:hypothetical protein [Winogradskyella jejuensis]SHH42859.1 hypothetical protein SAMN05444148_1995 [Winogradskyella jejuensis]